MGCVSRRLALNHAQEAVPEAEVSRPGHVGVNGVGRHEGNALLLEDGSHGPGGKAVGARHEGRYFILFDELVGEGHRFLGICPVVVVDQLHFLAQDASGGVHLVEGDLDRVEGARAVGRSRSRQGNEKADLHRVRGQAGGRDEKHRAQSQYCRFQNTHYPTSRNLSVPFYSPGNRRSCPVQPFFPTAPGRPHEPWDSQAALPRDPRERSCPSPARRTWRKCPGKPGRSAPPAGWSGRGPG